MNRSQRRKMGIKKATPEEIKAQEARLNYLKGSSGSVFELNNAEREVLLNVQKKFSSLGHNVELRNCLYHVLMEVSKGMGIDLAKVANE